MRFLRVLIPALLVLSLFMNIVFFQKQDRRRKVFTVNGQSVSKRDLTDFLEQKEGPAVKAALVKRMLIDQAAQNAKLTPTKEEIDEELNNIKEVNWQQARDLSSNPWKEGEMRHMIQEALEMQSLQAKDVPVTDEDIKTEYNATPAKYDTPDKVKMSLGLVLDESRVNDIKQLLEQKVSPSVIMQNNRKAVAFIGDNYRYTVMKAFGTPSNNPYFKMKPNEVKVQDVGPDLKRQGVKKAVCRLEEIIPGKKADLNDPKTRKKINLYVALQHAHPVGEILHGLWASMDFQSEDPADKQTIERMLFPETNR